MWERNVVGAVYIDQDRETRNVILSLAKSIQERDVVTYEHSRRVATYVQRLARHLGWTRRDARDLALAALVHDLGKTWIANNILNKSGALSEDERRKMEQHPVIGARILIGYEVDSFYVETVLHHHEKWNGQGYPANKAGEEIPMGARLLTIADVYDVLTSWRPYKNASSTSEARDRILADANVYFDPLIVDAFVHLLDTMPNFTLPQQDLHEKQTLHYPPHLDEF